jgi:hypothetical protein
VPQLQFLDLRILLHLQKIADRGIFLDWASAAPSLKLSTLEKDRRFQNCHLRK